MPLLAVYPGFVFDGCTPELRMTITAQRAKRDEQSIEQYYAELQNSYDSYDEDFSNYVSDEEIIHMAMCQKGNHEWHSAHPEWDMQAYCVWCGAHEE